MAEPLVAAPPVSDPESRWRGEGLSMEVCPPTPIVHLESPREGVNAPMLPAAGQCISHDGAVLLSIGPGTYLRIGGNDDYAMLDARFTVAVDVGSAWTNIAIAGARAVELLRKGCAVDLHPRAFSAGACCSTGLAGMRAVLWRPRTGDRYELLVARSYAQSLWSWLLDAAAPYGSPHTKERLQ